MRVSALYFRNKYVLTFLALESVAAISVGCWAVTRPPGGYGTDLQKSLINPRSQAAAFSGLLVFDFSIFTLSACRSISLRGHNEPFLHRFFMDGLVYYGVTWSVNLVNVIVLATIDPSKDMATSVFANVLSVVMVSRLMINLHDPMLRKSMERGEAVDADVASRTGHISTFLLDGIFSPSTQADLSMELITLDLCQETAPGPVLRDSCHEG
ncbi:hypothetical protein EI94DRAFT_1715724 [Lactarius quietus]|nr:hypothetical protein EI94DRAFT_1715724 [Lactarius quietus]